MKCERCTGENGAHFGFCFVAQLWDRVMGPTHPWSPPPAVEEPGSCLHDVPLDMVCNECELVAAEWMQSHLDDGFDDEFAFGGQPTLDPEWEKIDPPQPKAVAEDAAVAMGASSDAEWLPHGMWIAPEPGEPHCEAVTHLPDGYYDDKVEAQPKPERDPKYADRLEKMRQASLAAQARAKAEREDIVVQFVYDTLDTVPGVRTRFDDVYGAFLDWCKIADRPAMTKSTMRPILEEMGIEMAPGRLPGQRVSGRAPILVHGYAVKGSKPDTVLVPAPTVEVKAPVTKPERTPRITGERPGPELHKDMAKLIMPLLTEHGWSYSVTRRGPKLTSPGGKPVSLPGTKVMQGRSLNTTKTNLRKAGAPL